MTKLIGVIVASTFLLAACSDYREYSGSGYRASSVKTVDSADWYRRRESERY